MSFNEKLFEKNPNHYGCAIYDKTAKRVVRIISEMEFRGDVPLGLRIHYHDDECHRTYTDDLIFYTLVRK